MKREQVLPHVMADMAARIAKGADEYGEPLTTFNGRDALVDSYEEAMDLAVYLKQAIMERDARGAEAAKWPAGMNSTTGYAQPYVVTRVDGPGAPGHVTYASTGESLDDTAKRAAIEAINTCDNTSPATMTFADGGVVGIEAWPGPDWSQAPEWARWWVCGGPDIKGVWYSERPTQGSHGEYWIGQGRGQTAPTFGYTGDWRDSLRKRQK